MELSPCSIISYHCYVSLYPPPKLASFLSQLGSRIFDTLQVISFMIVMVDEINSK